MLVFGYNDTMLSQVNHLLKIILHKKLHTKNPYLIDWKSINKAQTITLFKFYTGEVWAICIAQLFIYSKEIIKVKELLIEKNKEMVKTYYFLACWKTNEEELIKEFSASLFASCY